MKRLIVSALFVSVFFIGISGLINSASAKFRTDEKAMELIRAARVAIGGEQNIAQVRSMTIKGTTAHFFEKAGVQDVKQGGMEIDFELPGKFSKRIKIGTPGVDGAGELVDKDVDIIVEKVDGATSSSADGKENVFVIRKGDDKNVEWVSEDDADIKVADGKVFVKKDDGTVEELSTDGRHKVIVRTDDGNVTNVDIVGDENTWVSEDGQKRVLVKEDKEFGPHKNSTEMLRTTMALLLTAPEDGSVTYEFVGQGNVDGFPSNIIEVGSHGSSFKLYLDAGSNLPQMISYEAHGPNMIHFSGDKKATREMHDKMKNSAPVEKQIKFSDFREVGGLLLPHRWTESSGGKAAQNIDITGYEINPSDIASKFSGQEGGQRVMIRKQKN